MVSDVEDFFGFRFKTFFLTSSRDWISSVLLTTGAFKFKFVIFIKYLFVDSRTPFSSAITILFSAKVILEDLLSLLFLSFIVFIYYSLSVFQSKLSWLSSTVLNSNFFAFYKGTSSCNFSFFVILIFEFRSFHNFLSKFFGHKGAIIMS